MAAPIITRTAIVDDDGTGTTGTILGNTWKQELYDQIDAVIASEDAVVTTVPHGGTGVATLAAHGVLVGNAAAAVNVTGAGAVGQVLTSGGASADPSFKYQGSNGVCDGRLTLTSGTPTTTSDVTGATNIYWTPCKGNRIGLYDGSAQWNVLTFTEIAQALGTLVNGQAYDVFAYNNAGVVATEILEWANATVTVTIAAPGVVTWTAHGLTTGLSFVFTTSGALPTGLAANTVYYVTVVDANTFKLSTTLANVSAATFITTSGTQSGTHTGHNPNARATALALQDGVLVKSGTTTRRYLGSFLTTATTTTEDSYAKRLLFNYYNRARRPLRVLEATSSWTYTTATLRQANASASNQLAVLIGVADVPIEAHVQALASNASSVSVTVVIGEDSTSAAATGCLRGAQNNVAGSNIQNVSSLRTFPALGLHVYTWLEYSQALGTTTWYGNFGGSAVIQSGILATIEG